MAWPGIETGRLDQRPAPSTADDHAVLSIFRDIMGIKVIAAWTITVLLLLFMAQNFETVRISLLLWTVELPRAVMILLVFAAGIVLGWLVGTIRAMEKRERE
jgi:uncharacterized integral membrane protein